ncbi:MAG: glycosyltransferase family 4 protein [Candidatus Niyogibacteria bacterium]|nr:MAG: glycosyltransferase family 4 protein [Candidatus Niyogibacteria bacterium]
MHKILVITPRFPLPDAGACEKDRLSGIKQLKRLGFDVRILAKVFDFQPKDEIEKFSQDFGTHVNLLPYENKLGLRKILNPFYWDGAAYEYASSVTKKALIKILDEFGPDLVWVDYTYLWPLYGILRRRKIPIITRSINFEPWHFLQEDGYSPLNIIKSLSKLLSEIITIHKSDFLFAITRKEEKIYRLLGARNTVTLPLRGLPVCLKNEHQIKNKEILNVFFAGSTYSVSHNKKALELILKNIAPAALQKYPGRFIFHITGRKFPEDFKPFLGKFAVYHGTINRWEEFLEDMDIAVVPSLYGAGMQQKIFEPMCRGIPTVASSRGLAEYPFKNEEHLLLAKTPNDFVNALIKLLDTNFRKKLSENSINLSKKLFSQEILDLTVLSVLNKLCAR